MTVAPKAATELARRPLISSFCCAGFATAAGRGGMPPTNEPQLIERALTAAVTFFSPVQAAFGWPSGQNTPDCQPARSRSS